MITYVDEVSINADGKPEFTVHPASIGQASEWLKFTKLCRRQHLAVRWDGEGFTFEAPDVDWLDRFRGTFTEHLKNTVQKVVVHE